MLLSNYICDPVGTKNNAIAQFALTGISRAEAQKAVRSCVAMASTVAQAAVDCIKESDSVNEVVSFAGLNPSVYVFNRAIARIEELSSSRRESIIIGGHETNE